MSDIPAPSAPTEAPSTESTSADASESTNVSEESQSVSSSEGTEETNEVGESDSSGPKKYTVTVDGEEIEVDETELLRGYQLRKASDKKFRQAAEERKKTDALIKLLRDDPISALEHPDIGLNFREFAEKYLADQIEYELATPEEREKQDKLKRLEMLEKENAELKKSTEEKQLRELTAHYQQEYEKNISGALEKSGLPKTNQTVRRMAYYMSQALENGYELQPLDVVDLVRKDYVTEINDLLGASDGQVLMDLLGDGIAGKIRKFDVERLKKEAAPPQEETETPTIAPKSSKKRMTMEELSNYLKTVND